MEKYLHDTTVVVRFTLPATLGARTASVCGDFNGWVAYTHPMSRLPDGSFALDVALPPGDRWRFRYLVDGDTWLDDAGADGTVPNPFGGVDSIVDLTDVSALPRLPPPVLPALPSLPDPRASSAPASPHASSGTGRTPDEGTAPWWQRLVGRTVRSRA